MNKNMKEFDFGQLWAEIEFLSTMFQVMYYLRYRFSRPVLSCVISGPSELSIGAIKIFGLIPTLWSVCESLHGVAHNSGSSFKTVRRLAAGIWALASDRQTDRKTLRFTYEQWITESRKARCLKLSRTVWDSLRQWSKYSRWTIKSEIPREQVKKCYCADR